MNRISLALILAGLGLSIPANAAFAPADISALSALPVTPSGIADAPMAASLRSLPLSPLLPAPMLPSPSLPVNVPKSLPGVWNHLPVELPAEAAVPVPKPSHDVYHLDWSFLDGGNEAALAASPAGPATSTLSPASARAQLAYAAEVFSHDVAAAADLVYNGAASVR